MSAIVHRRHSIGLRLHPATVAVALFVVASVLTLHRLGILLPKALWWRAILAPDLADPRQLIVAYGFIPRVLTALICGASLALAGVVFQQVMRNPLAEPGTLGVSAGAFLALTIATVLAPDLAGAGRGAVALVGAASTTIIVFAVALRQKLAPLALVLGGLIVGLTCGGVASTLLLFANPYDLSLYLWGAGSLSQNDWSVVAALSRAFVPCALAIPLLMRPLELLGLEEVGARSLGLRLFWFRGAALTVAVALSAAVVSSVGVIGFVGLVAPALGRFSGARRLAQQLVWSPLIGACLLWTTDQLALLIAGGDREWIPTGAATTILGAPVLLGLLARIRPRTPPIVVSAGVPVARLRRPGLTLLVAAGILMAIIVVSLSFGQGLHGWRWTDIAQTAALLQWRGPRLFGALAAGAMIAVAGSLLQRMTGNPMAAPEILGIGAGAAMGLIILAFLAPLAGQSMRFASAALGASATLVLILALGRRVAFAPDRLLLGGVAVAACFNALTAAAMATGNPRVAALRLWMAGSVDLVTPAQATFACAVALVLISIIPAIARWLVILPLGGETARALGVGLTRSRLALLLLAAVLSAAATLVIGPLGFVGLMGPHMARMIGLQRPIAHAVGSAVVGALVMVVADWFGRNILFPYQLPVGLLAALVGGPYFMWLMSRPAASRSGV